jgi:hypothetical protein
LITKDPQASAAAVGCIGYFEDGKTTSKIEDFFDATTLGMKLGTKTFTDQNEFDATRYYGKKLFAEEVVAKHAAHINFSGFKPLLTNICAVIKDHAKKVTPAQTTQP